MIVAGGTLALYIAGSGRYSADASFHNDDAYRHTRRGVPRNDPTDECPSRNTRQLATVLQRIALIGLSDRMQAVNHISKTDKAQHRRQTNAKGDNVIETVADQLAETLATAGVKRVHGIVGDSPNSLTGTLRRQGKIEWVHVRRVCIIVEPTDANGLVVDVGERHDA